MKGFIGVTDNDWSNKGSRSKAQGSSKLKARIGAGVRDWGWSRNDIRLMALGTRQPGIDVVNFLPKTTRQKDRG